jgi:outer membrane protein OmpA-like peptidoglycan-associated protein
MPARSLWSRSLLLAAAVTLTALVACETAPATGSSLGAARERVAAVAGDPNVAKLAAPELTRAQSLLASAEQSTRGAMVEHYAYLALQMARIAEQRTHEALAAQRIEAANSERESILSKVEQDSLARGHEAAQAEDAALALARRLPELAGRQTARGLVLTLDDMLFDSNRVDLKPAALGALEQIREFLATQPERFVHIEGFTDDTGSNRYNLEFSQSRADVIAMYMIRGGIEPIRVRATGFGEMFPIAKNVDDDHRRRNRRVEIILSSDARAIPARAPIAL